MSLTASQPLLGPLVALGGWTSVMEAWMYALRIPALSKYNVKTDPTMTKESMNAQFPPAVKWPADNFNHLHESPTRFYAIALALTFLGDRSDLSKQLAWTYVGLRILHSAVQGATNIIPVRFALYLASSGVLAGLTARAAMIVYNGA